MIQLTPIAIATDSQQYDVKVVENLCQAYCLTQDIQPAYSISFVAGTPIVVNGTAFVNITVNGAITYKPYGCSCNSKVKQFTETFQVAFVGTGTPTIALTVGSQTSGAENVKCCNKVYGYGISTNLTITATFPT